MFSLVHEIFDQPLPLLLETIQLPEDIQEALLSRTGLHGPLLQLAEAMEHEIRSRPNAWPAICCSIRHDRGRPKSCDRRTYKLGIGQ